MADADHLALREVRRADLPELAALLREPWPEIDWELRFARQWFENPAWNPEIAMGWVHEQDGALQAFFGSIPIPYWVIGRDGRAFAATSLYVRPAHRRRGLAQALIDAWNEQSGGELWVNSTSNEISATFFENPDQRKHSRAIEREGFRVALPCARAKIAATERLAGHPLRPLLEFPLTVAGAALLWLRRPRARFASSWSWQPTGDIGPEFDQLWERERGAHATTLRRDSRTLEWLYLGGPNAARNSLLLGRDPEGRPRALAGFREERESGLLRQVDLFGDLSDESALPALVDRATKLAARKGLAVVRLWLPDTTSGGGFDRLGLESRACGGTIYYRFGETLDPPVTPRFTDLDGDRCLDLLV
jgi:GNAT superfamily N-acetyltransferase